MGKVVPLRRNPEKPVTGWDALHSARCIVMAAINRFGDLTSERLDAVMAEGVIFADIGGTQYKITVEKA